MSKQTEHLHRPISIPAAFWEEHMPHDAVCRYFGWDEQEFFLRYTSHQLPHGVNLQPICGIPFIVFRLADLIAWEEAGCPPQPGSAELRSEVLHSLIDACRAEGVAFPDDIAEAN